MTSRRESKGGIENGDSKISKIERKRDKEFSNSGRLGWILFIVGMLLAGGAKFFTWDGVAALVFSLVALPGLLLLLVNAFRDLGYLNKNRLD